jgi:hypothetical protein
MRSCLFIIFLCLTLMLSGCSGQTKPENIAAVPLAEIYEEDESAANDEYKGKTLRVSGKLEAMDTTVGGKLYVDLSGTDKTSIRCLFDSENKESLDSLVGLSPGDTLTITGVCDGIPDRFYVTLSQCEVES